MGGLRKGSVPQFLRDLATLRGAALAYFIAALVEKKKYDAQASSVWKINNPEKVKAQGRLRNVTHRKWKNEYMRIWRQRKDAADGGVHRLRRNSLSNTWQKKNRILRRPYLTAWRNNRRRINPAFRIKGVCSARLYKALKSSGKAKNARTLALVGCTIPELIKHLEAQFQPGMTWENHSLRGWHIDHIRPCASFDLTDPDQQRVCFHYTNLQPLWARENLIKNDRWDPPAEQKAA